MKSARTRRRWGRLANEVAFYVLVVVFVVPFMFPLYWMVSSSLKTPVDIIASPPIWTFQPTISNYLQVFQRNPFSQYILNSTVVAIGATLLGLLFGLPAAYSIARYRQKGLALAILVARMTPGLTLLVPWFILFTRVQMIGSYWALIIAHATLTLPLTIWIMIGFYEDLPDEVLDAGLVDGCSVYGAFLRVALPLSLSGIVVSGILSFIWSWNEFLLSVVLSNTETRTLPVVVYNFIGEFQIEWGGVMASATVIVLPVLLLTLLVQRHIVKGLTAGSVKG